MLDVIKDVKEEIDQAISEKLNYISKNTFIFFDERVGYFNEEMNLIRQEVGEHDSNYKSIADSIVILFCKVLQLQIGKVIWLINQKDLLANKVFIQHDSDLLVEIKLRLQMLETFHSTKIGRNEITKELEKVHMLKKKLNPNFLTRLFR